MFGLFYISWYIIRIEHHNKIEQQISSSLLKHSLN
jgi:hypothetical protein